MMGLGATLRDFTKKKTIALLAILAGLKDRFDNCGKCEGDVAEVLPKPLLDGANEMHETNTDTGINSNGCSLKPSFR